MTDNLRRHILTVLADGRVHDGGEFLDGRHGFRCSSYSQRIGALVREGCCIERTGAGGHDLGRYRLVSMSGPTADAVRRAMGVSEDGRLF